MFFQSLLCFVLWATTSSNVHLNKNNSPSEECSTCIESTYKNQLDRSPESVDFLTKKAHEASYEFSEIVLLPEDKDLKIAWNRQGDVAVEKQAGIITVTNIYTEKLQTLSSSSMDKFFALIGWENILEDILFSPKRGYVLSRWHYHNSPWKINGPYIDIFNVSSGKSLCTDLPSVNTSFVVQFLSEEEFIIADSHIEFYTTKNCSIKANKTLKAPFSVQKIILSPHKYTVALLGYLGYDHTILKNGTLYNFFFDSIHNLEYLDNELLFAERGDGFVMFREGHTHTIYLQSRGRGRRGLTEYRKFAERYFIACIVCSPGEESIANIQKCHHELMVREVSDNEGILLLLRDHTG